LAELSVADGTLRHIEAPFIGSEAIASRSLTPYALRTRFVALYPDVYIPLDTVPSAVTRARAAWLWSGRQGVVAGQSAVALYGAKWVDNRKPAELLWPNRRPPKGIAAWSDRFAEDEVEVVARATELKIADVEVIADRFRGRRGIRKARTVLGSTEGASTTHP
jgi:hypothetical protein